MRFDRFPAHLRPGIAALGDDPEFREIRDALSAPGSSRGLSRRTFLQAVVATGGATALSVGPLARLAEATGEPLGEGDPILVVIQLGGGNDGLNTVVPTQDPAYAALRPAVSAASGAIPLGGGGLALHASLPRLAARYHAGKVAIVQGVGNTDLDHSHFTSMATWMAGTTGTDRTTGWLGRYLDTVPDADRGFAAVTLDAAVPLHLSGATSEVSALGTGLPFGSKQTSGAELAMFDAVGRMGADSALGAWPAAVGRANRAAIDRARGFAGVYASGTGSEDTTLTGQLERAAWVINANLGVRVLDATLGSFDTHRGQTWTHQLLLDDLDLAIETFYASLDPRWSDQVVLMTFSEFGRRAADNGSGTDHGTSAPLFVIGDRVRGGLHGSHPSLTDLDSRGDLAVTVDFRSVYASVLARWLGAEPSSILGAAYPEIDLFRSTPPAPPTGPALQPDPRFAPFRDVSAFTIQQFQDFRRVHPTEAELGAWGNYLFWGFATIPAALEVAYLDSDLYRLGLDAARIAWIGTATPPDPEDLWRWTGMRKAGESTRVIAAEVVASGVWLARYGRLWGNSLVRQVHADAFGTAASTDFLATWGPQVTASTEAGAAALLDHIAASAACRFRFHHRAVVASVHGAMLRQAPTLEMNRQLAAYMDAGVTVMQLVDHFFRSAPYQARFAGG